MRDLHSRPLAPETNVLKTARLIRRFVFETFASLASGVFRHQKFYLQSNISSILKKELIIKEIIGSF